MKSPVRAAVWFLALILFTYAIYSVVIWSTRAAPGTAEASPPAQASDVANPALTLASSETQTAPTAEAPAQGDRPFGQLPAFQTRRTTPGEEFYRQGQYDKAVEFWEGMAKQGDREANFRLGQEYLYATSGAVKRDAVKSREYHLAAAKLGEPRSMFDLGTIYEYGMGTPANIPEAAKWYKLSADYGSAQGQYNIATMLETGEGVPQDLVEAFKYFLLAAEQGFYGVGYDPQKKKGDSSLPTPIELLSKKVTPDQGKEAHARADAFKPLTGPLKN